jgi:hypothetical protein
MAYATEAHLFITDLNQSPFNVGTRLMLEDFTLEQVADLNRRHGEPLKSVHDVSLFYDLVGGCPYLVRRGLFAIAANGLLLHQLEESAIRHDGPFHDHMERLLHGVSEDTALAAALKEALYNAACNDVESFYRLRAAGILAGEPESARLRCRLYTEYFKRRCR